ncbi:MAG: glutamate formiminotransferase / formiminotetrahydrofolate cyclodeaminase, partial [Solirubrobacteraceae bacterium]|nr:glutamate formiminotransferase / formiminotetrahydrofolate cyclodeaminase [Solirubrobacteraceae bacterium]
SDAPTPGGGAVAGVVAAAAGALIAMVGRLTLGKDEFADVAERMQVLIVEGDAARATFLDLADKDAHAFDGVMAAFKMPKGTDEEKRQRSVAIQAGYLDAARVPMEIAQKALALMGLALEATATGNPAAATDGWSGAGCAYAAVVCAMANVEINAAAIKDDAARASLVDEVTTVRSRAEQLLREGQTAFQMRIS